MRKCGLNPSDKERGTNPPKASIVTSSVALRFDLLVNGPYITSNSSVWLSPNRQLLKILPVDLPIRAWPFAIFALKNRTAAHHHLSAVLSEAIGRSEPAGRLPQLKPRDPIRGAKGSPARRLVNIGGLV
jgi:hypothetical protein